MFKEYKRRMKFKLAPEVLAVLVLFIVVIFIANYGSCRGEPAPFHSFARHFPYKERFEGAMPPGPLTEEEEEDEREVARGEGFTTLSPGVIDTSAWSTIDVVGGLPSSSECIGNSFGYTKGAGGVCFDDQTKKLLLSRGGQGF
jgi:hypothetical protein